MNTKQLYNILSKGAFVAIKCDNKYLIITPLKDGDGIYRTSAWWSSIEEAKQNFGYCLGYSEEYLSNLNAEIVEIYYPPFESFKVGDKVKILDSIKDTDDWENIEEEYPDMEGEIEDVWNETDGPNYYVYNKNKSISWCISHQYLIPLNTDQVEEMTVEQICKELGRNIKIIK